MRVFLTLWSAGNPAGSQEFIPNPVDRAMVINSFQILTAATKERKIIQKEYIDYFGYKGVDLYNELLANITDKYKKALPFVNMCLRAWRKRLEDDDNSNLWANLSCFDFDFWLSDETRKRKREAIKERRNTSS